MNLRVYLRQIVPLFWREASAKYPLLLQCGNLHPPSILLAFLSWHERHPVNQLREVLDAKLDAVGQARGLLRETFEITLIALLPLLIYRAVEHAVVEGIDLCDVALERLERVADGVDLQDSGSERSAISLD